MLSEFTERVRVGEGQDLPVVMRNRKMLAPRKQNHLAQGLILRMHKMRPREVEGFAQVSELVSTGTTPGTSTKSGARISSPNPVLSTALLQKKCTKVCISQNILDFKKSFVNYPLCLSMPN